MATSKDLTSATGLLSSIPAKGDSVAEHLWLHDILAWLLSTPVQFRTERLSLLAQELDKHGDSQVLCTRLSELWNHRSAGRVLSEAGLPDQVFFFSEVWNRALDRILPSADPNEDLYTVLESLDLEKADAKWINSLSDPMWQRWSPVLTPPKPVIQTAVKGLAIRTAAIALSRDVMRLFGQTEDQSPMFHLVQIVSAAAENPLDSAALTGWEQCREQCLQMIEACHKALDKRGASAAVTFRLHLLASQIARIDTLLQILSGKPSGRHLVMEIVRGFSHQRGIVKLISAATRRVSQQVVEQAGRAGEHYIAHDRAKWFRMGIGGLGAGAITAFTAWFKYGITAGKLAPLIVGVAHAINYSSSFILMQLLGFPLASKMPAMTGVALAGGLGRENSEDRVAVAASIVRTQVNVTLANVVATVAVAFAVSRIFILVTGHTYLDAETAAHRLRSFHPLLSLTIPFAAATGVMLWISSLVTGWTANWMAFRGLTSAIRQSFRLRRRFSTEQIDRIADFVGHHLPGITGYLALGFLLGFLPVLCQLAGIPLEVRHVTLGAASVTYDMDSLLRNGALNTAEAIWAFLGVACIGALNLSAAFACGFIVALRARPEGSHGARHFAATLASELIRNPRRFLLPDTIVD